MAKVATGLNPYFNMYSNINEQALIDQLLIESVSIFGVQVYYLPRQLNNYNQLYGEDPISSYNSAYLIEMYLRNTQGFGGDGDFMSIIGLQIRDTLTMSVAKSRFFTEIGDPLNLDRPRESDLLYFPFNKKLFMIKFVEHEAIFYQMGQLQTYDLQCELWEYSNEQIATGVPEIDAIGAKYNFSMTQGEIQNDANTFIASSDGHAIVQSAATLANTAGPAIADNATIEEFFRPLVDDAWDANNEIAELE